MFEAARTAAASSGGGRATAPAIPRAAELGVDLASLKVQGLVTAKTVEAAAGELARPPAPDLPMPLAAPSGVERTVLIGAGLGATQVIDILPADESKMAVAIVDDDQGRWADQVAGVPVVGGTDELKEHMAENRFDSVVIAISTSVLLGRGSASCAESRYPACERDRPERPDRRRGGVRRWERRVRLLPLRSRYAHQGYQLSVRVRLLRSPQRRWDGHPDRTRLHDLGPDAHRRSGAPWDGYLHRAARRDRRGRPGSVRCCDSQLRAGGPRP
jgi:hypothetical protein